MSTISRLTAFAVACSIALMPDVLWAREEATPPVGATPVAPNAASARDQAITRFQRGMELFGEQDFNAALIEFRKAYELAPNFKVLYNVGQVCFQLQDYACALRSFESYLFEGGAEVTSERKAEVNREIEKLKLRVGKLEITTNVPDVEITVDDLPVGNTPLPSAISVSAGKRRLGATKKGRIPLSRTLEVPGAETIKLSLVLDEVAGGTTYRERPSKMTAWSWVGLGTAAALGVGATVTGIAALGAQNTLRDTRFAASDINSDVTSNQSKVKNLALATDILAGAAVVTAGVTLYFTLTRDPEQHHAKPEIALGVSPTGGYIAGKF